MGKISRAFETFHEAIGHHWKWWFAVTVPSSYALVSAITTRLNGDGYFGFLIPTVPKVSYTVALLSILLAIGMWKYAHSLRLASIPRISLERVTTRESDVNSDRMDVFLGIKNHGLTDLKNCLVKIDDLSGSGDGFSPQALMNASPGQASKGGSFNLRGGETKDIPLCHYRASKGDSFARLVIYWENGDVFHFDPDLRDTMILGLYSEAPPNHAKLKFERKPDGVVSITEIKDG